MPPQQTQTSRRQGNSQKAAVVPPQGKLLPQAIDFEEAVLGALMLEKDAYSVISDILKPETFYDHKNQLIYQAIQTLALNQEPIDMLTVKNRLEQDGNLEQVGGAFRIATLTENVGSASHIEYHAKVLAKKALARQLIEYSSRITSQAFDETTDIEQLMQEAEGNLFQLSQHNIKKDTQQIDPIISEALKKIEQAANRAEGLSGLPTGFTELDNMTSGWQNTDLIIIAARPAMGKTAFALSMVKNMAVNYNIPIGMFSLEMSNLQLVNRLLQNVCEITGEKVKSGRLTQDEWMQLTTKIKDLQGAPIYVDDTPSLSVFELRTKARRLVREHGVKIIMIDYLQLMNASGMQFGSREQEVSNISRSLKGLAKELNIPIIALSQLNRGVENRQGGAQRPQLSDLRESGAIEQDADMVCFIHRPEYYKIYEDEKGNDLRGLAEIIIAKHRSGAVGDVKLRFRGEFVRFQNRDEDSSITSTLTHYPQQQGSQELGSRMNDFVAPSAPMAEDPFLNQSPGNDVPF
ncbi:MAG: replicative DNA helicase [Bacteroidales bacterium]|nr:replicative DNA helicase [Candidatus Liminaster caballi]